MYKRNKGFFKNNFSKISPYIGVGVVIIAFSLFWYYESIGREKWTYESVVVLKEEVKKGEVIRADNLEYLPIEMTTVLPEAIKNTGEITDLAARHFIPSGTQLHPYYFDSQTMVAEKDELIFNIPREWIYSVPNTLRRKDTAYIFELTLKDLERIGHAETTTSSEQEGNEQPQPDELSEIEEIQQFVETHESEDASRIRENLGRSLLQAPIAYVKDQANREVITTSREDRIDGSSRVSDVEVLLTPEQFELLKSVIDRGSRLVIMYNEGDVVYESNSDQ